MPGSRPDPADAARDLIDALQQAGELTAEPDVTGYGPGSPGFRSATPGNTAAIDTITAAEAWARRCEANAVVDVTGSPRSTPRAPSTAASRAAVEQLGLLASSTPDEREIVTGLARWTYRLTGLAGIGTAIKWEPIPGDPLCPYCSTASLRRAENRVQCWCDGCADKDGFAPPSALLVMTPQGEPQIEWRDGTITRAHNRAG